MTRLNKAMKLAAGFAILGLLAGCAGGFGQEEATGGPPGRASFSNNGLTHPDIAGGPSDLVSHSDR